LVTTAVYVTDFPAVREVGLAAAVSVSCTATFTVLPNATLLSPVAPSVATLATVADALIAPVRLDAIRKVTTVSAEPLGTIVPSEAVTAVELITYEAPVGTLTDCTLVPAGMFTVNTVLGAFEGPPLTVWTVYVNGRPAVKLFVLLAVAVRCRSALIRTVIGPKVAALLPCTGSNSNGTPAALTLSWLLG
jgi:hypothetical protein